METDSKNRQLEEELYRVKAELEQCRILYENLPIPYFTLDSVGNILAINPSGAAQLRYVVSELVGQPISALFSSEDVPTLQLALTEALQRPQQAVRFQGQQICQDGQAIWVKATVKAIQGTQYDTIALLTCEDITAVRDEIGNSVGTQGTFWNITEQTYLKQAPQVAEAKLSDILNNAIAAITSFRVFDNLTWQHDYWSTGCEAIFGYTPEELMNDGMLWTSRVMSDDAEFVFGPEAVAAIVKANSTIHEYRFRHKDGTIRWISATLASHWDEVANCWIVTVVNTDISDRKDLENKRQQAEAALRESEERFRQLAENIQKVFWMASFVDEKRILYISPAYEKIWQRSCESLYEQPADWINAVHPEDQNRVCIALEQLIEGNFDIEYRIIRPDGSIRWIHDRAFPIQAHDGGVYRVAGIAEDITKRKQTEVVLHQQAERERLLGDIAQRIRQSLDLDEILNTTVTEVRQVLQADRAIIFRFQPDWGGVVAVESVASPWSTILGSTIYDPCFAEAYVEQYRQGRVRTIENIFAAGLGKCHLELLTQFQVRANLVVPILQGDHLWGLLIAHQCSSPRQWQSYEVDLLKQLATQVAIALQQGHLYQQMQAHAQRQQSLNRVVQTIRNSLELSTIFTTAAAETAQLLQAKRADIVKYLPDQGYWLTVADHRTDSTLPDAFGMRIPDEGNEIATRLKRLEIVQIDDANSCEDEVNRVLAQNCPGSWLLIPLRVGVRIWGSLTLVRQQRSSWQATDVELALAIADQLAIAIHQSELYQQAQLEIAQRQQAEMQLRKVNRALRVLSECNTAIVQATEEPALLQAICSIITNTGGYRLSSISLLNPEEQSQLKVMASASDPKAQVKLNAATGLEPINSPVVTVMQTKRSCIIRNVPVHPNFTPWNAELFRQGCVASVALPLLDHDQLIGVLGIHAAEPDAFDTEEVQWLTELANKLTHGLVSLRIREEQKRAEIVLQRQAQQERLLGAITQPIHQALSLAEILNAMVREVWQFLQVDRVLIYRVWTDGTGSVVAEAADSKLPQILGQTFAEEVFPLNYQELYRQGRIRTINDIENEQVAPCLVEFTQQVGVKAKLIVPILHNSDLWGLLIAHQCDEPRQWQAWELGLLKQLATQLEIAIHQSQLVQQVQSLNDDLEQQVQERTTELRKAFDFEALLRRITDKVRDSLEENQILQTAVQELAIELQACSCDTGLYDLNQAQSTICYEYVNSSVGIPISSGNVVPFSSYPEIYNQLLQGQYLQFCWLPTFADPARLTDCPFTLLACPILDEQKVIGDLWLYRSAADSFEDVEIRLIQQVANHCAIALRQSRLYQSAQAQVEVLERLNHLKDDFLSTVSHELRTPVANIRMATQMLEINLDQLGILESQANSITRYLHVMHEECQREINLINDLLDLARIESETEPFIQASIDLSMWLSSIAEPFLERAQKQQQQLIIDVATQPLMLVTDIAYLERIITELLQNACKYTPPHETIRVTAQAQTTCIEICVSNTGVELPESELERIFDKFYRIPNSDPWRHGGTGLGLALVKRLVACLDGTIAVSSHTGQTAFMLQFPQTQADKKEG